MYIRNLFKHWSYRLFAPGLLLREKYEAFRDLLEQDKNSHELIAELQQIYYDQVKCDYCAITEKCDRLSHCVSKVIRCLAKLCPTKYIHLMDYFNKIDFYIKLAISLDETDFSPPFVISLDDVQAGDHRLVGGKAYTLSEIRKELHMPTVDGFVITTNAFNYFLEANDLRKEINKRLAALDVRSVNSVRSAAQALQQLIEESVVPEAIESEIKHALPTLQDNSGAEQRFAVRSSALGEDRQGSYAGQYKTILNVATESVVDAYKTVIASKYSNRALTYRIYRGETDQETPMAALVLPMINARVSGLIYTDDPNETAANITIRCAWGLGKAIVDGSIAPSTIAVGKMPPHQILRRDTSRQQSKAALKPEGGVAMISTGEESCAYAAINDQIIRELAGWALKLEKFYQTPQDIEWCLDFQDNLIFLQSRKLSLETQAPEAANCEEFASQTPLLLSGGERASGGIASGIVHNLEQNPSLEDIPEGTVLVTSVPHPDLVVVFSKIKALVSDLGSSAGHLASVAREFGIPGLVNTGSATRVLETGMVVTVNANSCKVHQGKAGKLIECVRNWSGTIPETPLNSKLAKALQYIAPLNLVDSEADNFAPETCKTFHDILRFSHEKAVLEMFSLGWTGSRRAGGAKRLMSDIPIVVYVLDLGGGIEGHQNDEKEVRIEAVQCVPMQALWRGLSHPDIKWNANVIHFNWGEFDRLSRGIVQPHSKNLGSYAIFSDDYLNFHIHFGYHFVVLDTLCTENADSNYILLRFAGGGGIIKSRLLRVQFLSDILSRAGFKIDQKGDMLDVQLTRCERAKLEDLLQMIGQLLGCTRLLDLVLEDSSQVEEMVHRFISGDFDLSPSARN